MKLMLTFQTCRFANWWLIYCCLVLTLLLLLPRTAFALGADWELQADEKQIQLYYRSHPGSAIPEFKAVTEIDSSMASIIALLLDIEACPDWVHQCKRSFALLTVSPLEQYIYQVNALPLVRDRDVILRATLNARDDRQLVQIHLRAEADFCKSETAPACAEIDEDRYVHIIDAVGHYNLEPLSESRTRLTWEHYIDPAGFLPDWLARSQLRQFPFVTLTNLRTKVQEAKYQNSKIVWLAEGLVIEPVVVEPVVVEPVVVEPVVVEPVTDK